MLLSTRLVHGLFVSVSLRQCFNYAFIPVSLLQGFNYALSISLRHESIPI